CCTSISEAILYAAPHRIVARRTRSTLAAELAARVPVACCFLMAANLCAVAQPRAQPQHFHRGVQWHRARRRRLSPRARPLRGWHPSTSYADFERAATIALLLMTKKIVTFGEIMLRLAPPGLEKFLQTPQFVATFGGGEANVAVSIAQLG